MLVLSRRENEAIRIGDNITLVVLSIDRNVVRLGIQAPQDTPIWREELKPNNRHRQPGTPPGTAGPS